MTTWQFTRFRVGPAREHEVLAARQESLHACWTASPPLQAAYLLRVGDGDWLDITVWAGQDCSETTDPELPSARSAFFGQLDTVTGDECGTLIAEHLPLQRHDATPTGTHSTSRLEHGSRS